MRLNEILTMECVLCGIWIMECEAFWNMDNGKWNYKKYGLWNVHYVKYGLRIMECEVGWYMNYAINECVKAWEEEEWLCVEPPAGLLHQAWS